MLARDKVLMLKPSNWKSLFLLVPLLALLSPWEAKGQRGSHPETIKFWNPATGKEVRSIGYEGDVTALVYSANGRMLATGTSDKLVNVHDAETGQLVAKLSGHTSAVQAVAFAPDSQAVVSGGWDRTVKVWQIDKAGELATLTGHSDAVLSVVFSSSGKLLASGSADRTVKVWDMSKRVLVFTLNGHIRSVNSVSVSADERLLASGSSDRTIRIWNLTTGKALSTLEGHKDSVEALAFSPDNKYLVSGSRDETVRIWDIASGSQIRVLRGHASTVTSVAFSPNGSLIASASYDRNIRIWEPSTGKLLRSLRGHAERITAIAFSPDGNTLASGSAASPRTAPTLHVISVGIGDYPNSKSKLRLAAKDAQDFGEELERIATNHFNRVTKQILVDGRATKTEVEAAFDRAIAESKPEDTFVFFFRGQSVIGRSDGSKKKQIHLTPSGIDPTEKEQAITWGIPINLLQAWLTKIEARHQLIILNTRGSSQDMERFVRRIEKENKELGPLLKRDVSVIAVQGMGQEPILNDNGFLVKTLRKAFRGERIPSLLSNSEDSLFRVISAEGVVTALGLAKYIQLSTAEAYETSFKFRELNFIGLTAGNDFTLGSIPKRLTKTDKNHHSRLVGFERAQLDRSLNLNKTILTKKPFESLRSHTSQEPSSKKNQFVRTGKDYALLIATDDYDHWPDLDNPIHDAREIELELRNYYGFKTEVIHNASRGAILKALLRYMREVTFSPDDQFFIFFAGHGTFNQEWKEGYIVAKDSKRNDEFGDSYISHSLLRQMIDNIPSKHIFLVIDACFSGTIGDFIARNRAGDDSGDVATEFLERKMQFKTRQFLTSGGKEYVPDGRRGHHSPFARRLLEALRSYGGASRLLTINTIVSHVERAIPLPRLGEWGGNEPGSDFVFVATVK